MPKAMKYRDLASKLRALGCTKRQGKGDHEIWTCPCGAHQTVLTSTTNLSQGLVVQAVRHLECLPKGWLA